MNIVTHTIANPVILDQIWKGDRRYAIMAMPDDSIAPGDIIKPAAPKLPKTHYRHADFATLPASIGHFKILSVEQVKIETKGELDHRLIVGVKRWQNSLVYAMAKLDGLPTMAQWFLLHKRMADRAQSSPLVMVRWRYLVKTTIALNKPGKGRIPAGSVARRSHTRTQPADPRLIWICFPEYGSVLVSKNMIAPVSAIDHNWPDEKGE